MENYSSSSWEQQVMKMAVKMAAVSMEKPSGALPRPRRANGDSLSPDLGRDGGGSEAVDSDFSSGEEEISSPRFINTMASEKLIKIFSDMSFETSADSDISSDSDSIDNFNLIDRSIAVGKVFTNLIQDWLVDYLETVKLIGGTRATGMQSIQVHLSGAARSWIKKLPLGSVDSWDSFEDVFVKNF
ncbi:hypothetical protein QYE76_045347 [Lolium multiflorum]|uniref:Retrotransposon gag domain-containing protein n=1 Tax=Lolium multiflorum TaxID=4521 RepID=A0AAD8WY03_LOLMU|nr:hypothetical protein QYE76_045347 [Lolium multiflorum]